MSIISWWRKRNSRQLARASKSRRSSNYFRPQLQCLESRNLLATLTVTTTFDVIDANDGALSLREAVIAANASKGADKIDVPANHYFLSLGTLVLAGDLTLAGSASGETVIDGLNLGTVLEVQSAANVNISNVTIQHGLTGIVVNSYAGTQDGTKLASLLITDSIVADNRGAGIENEYGTVMIDNCMIRGNGNAGIISVTREKTTIRHSVIVDNSSTYNGGGIYNAGVLIVSDSVISGNHAREYGGGLYSSEGKIHITRCLIADNSARFGGGIANTGWWMTVSDSTIADNVATRGGGGIYTEAVHEWYPQVVRNSVIRGNSAVTDFPGGHGSGGGISAYGITLVDCTFQDNFTNGNGGALFLGNQSVVNHCTFFGNSAADGGAIYVEGDVIVRGCTLTANTASHTGGGIANYGSLTVRDSWVVNNSALFGGDIYSADTLFLYDSVIEDLFST